MYKIGDMVVYGANGVLTVIDIRDEEIGDKIRTYYVLESASGSKDSLIFVPVDNEQLVASIRPLLSRNEVEKIISDIPTIPECEWIRDNRRRSENLKRIIDSADQRAIIGAMKSIHTTGLRRMAEGKKNYLADEGALQKAQYVLYSEFSIVLGVDYSDVISYIRHRCDFI